MNFPEVLPFLIAVLMAAAFDIAANMFITKSRGFKKKAYGFAALLLVSAAFTCLAFAVRGMDLAVAYALWWAFGILGTCLGGWLLFGQKIKPAAWAGMAVLVAGIFLLHLS